MSRNVAVRLAIRPMKSIEECRVDQGTGPDHAARVDEETAEETTQREADQLRGESKQELVCSADGLVVENALRGDNITNVCAAESYIGHNSDEDMLFDVERTRIQRPSITQGVKAGSR